MGELIAFSVLGLVALGGAVGLLNRPQVQWALQVMTRSTPAPEPPEPEPPPPRTPLHRLSPEQLGRFWER
jgi:hypothetical protein